MNSQYRKRLGFTLIELLVVIAIIALLLTIVMPSLRTARQIAQGAVCMAHLRAAGMGMQNYTHNHDQWMAGPNTTGLQNSRGLVDLDTATSPTTPVQNMDWISPTLGDELGLSNRGYQRVVDIFNTKLNCPANRVTYDYWYDGGEQPVDSFLSSKGVSSGQLAYSSYSAILGFHVWEGANVSPYGLPVKLPSTHRPRVTGIQHPGRKIYAIDGARYVVLNPAKGNVPWSSFNDFQTQIVGGNFMLTGPVYGLAGDPFMNLSQEMVLPGRTDLRQAPTRSELYIDYAFRHRQGINAVFFDGHVERMHWQDALRVGYYFPSGTEITHSTAIADPDARNGQIIR